MTARDRIALESAKLAYRLAREAGESPDVAERQGLEAARFVRNMK